MRITSPFAYFRVQGVMAFLIFKCTSRQTYLSESLRRSAPGSRPASTRIWKPLQNPATCPPRAANFLISSMIGEKRAIAPQPRMVFELEGLRAEAKAAQE